MGPKRCGPGLGPGSLQLLGPFGPCGLPMGWAAWAHGPMDPWAHGSMGPWSMVPSTKRVLYRALFFGPYFESYVPFVSYLCSLCWLPCCPFNIFS